MATSSFSGSGGGWDSNESGGKLPVMPCPLCGKLLVDRVAKSGPNAGRRFYKCTRLEHTAGACKFYKFEEDYEEWLIAKGHIRRRMAITRQNTQPALGGCNDSAGNVPVSLQEIRADFAKNIEMFNRVTRDIEKLKLVVCLNFVLALVILLVCLVS